ncbi:MAG: leucine-rich repeat protein [Clostridia bacterium]|nr:leucine-rich repeat protein [Clostridia bacterium]
MKRNTVLRMALLMGLLCILLLGAVACGDAGTSGNETTATPTCTVTFDSKGGTEIVAQTIRKNQTVTRPQDPVRKGFVFGGWYQDTMPFSFDDTVIRDITLTATWIAEEDLFSYVRTDVETEIIVTGLAMNLPETQTLWIPETIKGLTVVGIGDRAFVGLQSETLTRIVIPSGVRSVGTGAFMEVGLNEAESTDLSQRLIRIELNGALSEIGEHAFAGCIGLQSVSFAEGLTEIPFNAFSNCASLTVLSLPSTVTAIRENAFLNCSSVISVILPAELARIEDSAFMGCERLQNVFTLRTEGEGAADEIVGANAPLANASLYYYAAEKPASGNAWYWDEDTPKIWK